MECCRTTEANKEAVHANVMMTPKIGSENITLTVACIRSMVIRFSGLNRKSTPNRKPPWAGGWPANPHGFPSV